MFVTFYSSGVKVLGEYVDRYYEFLEPNLLPSFALDDIQEADKCHKAA
jgi:hypothetical protein